MLKKLILTVGCLLSGAFAVHAQDTAKPAPTPNTETVPTAKPAKKTNARPKVPASKVEPFEKATVAEMAAQCVKFETDAGAMEFELYPESAAETVRSFLNLTAIGAFDTTTFSRVVPDFVVQGGDLFTREKMTAALDQRARRILPDEPNLIKHERGVLSMARGDEPNTTTTSFFILLKAAPFLDGKFAAFGRVISGMENFDAINKMPVENEKPVKPVRISRAVVRPCASVVKP